jgi:hypothetical protein
MPAPAPQDGMADPAGAPWAPYAATVPTFDVTTAVVPAG